MTFNDFRAHASAYLAKLGVATDHEWHKAVTAFIEWADQSQQEKDAVALLTSRGYSVTPPPTAG